ncbi:testis-expressed basic protein 1-like [Argopecten irradians]|uniref:testis-expressed basic protein 1-like n=1 Tax=Argopecten irradians TaxID=31199 RepID=UPI003714FB6F
MKRVNNLHVGESSDFHLTDDPTFQPLLAPTNNTTEAVIEGSLSSNCISSESVAMDCASDTEETANTSDRKPGSSGAEIKTDGSGDETHVKSAVTGDETQVKSVVTGDETQVKSAVTGDETQVKSAVTGDETQVKSVVTGDETQVKSSREKKMKGSKGEKQAKIANGWPRNETHEQAKQNGLVQPIFKGFIKDSSQED